MPKLTDDIFVPDKAWTDEAKSVLTEPTLKGLAALHRRFEPRRRELLAARQARQAEYDAGKVPQYLDRGSEAVKGAWQVAPLPEDILCRRVEITGPVNSAKMVINMLSRNSEGHRADAAMLDFEDSMKPSWANVISGVHNVIGAARGDLSFSERTDKGEEKVYRLDPNDRPLVMVRVRGLHLAESNFTVDGQPISGGLFDLFLTALHSAKILLAQNRTPKYYVPKCEHHLEARWWHELFSAVEDIAGLKNGTIKTTFLIETLPAAYQMEEILYELRDRAAGLNGGRWDKIFSDIKTLKFHPDRILADRSQIDMHKPWMANYVLRLIEVCHSRGAFAMGGMSAFTPGKTPEIREKQTAKVIADKQHEADIGHDGCWVSHPYFIGRAMSAFKDKNQLGRKTSLPDKYPDLLPIGQGPRTEPGLRTNVRVGIAYMHGWIRDIGCVAWDDLMEDLATLEISRAQVWQWLHHKITLDGGPAVSADYVKKIFDEEFSNIQKELGFQQDPIWERAKKDAQEIFLKEKFPDFFSLASDPVV